MKPNIYDPKCPTRAVLDRVGDKWTALVILVLLDGPQRFSHLRGQIGGIAPKVLTETLRRLERDGILTRTAFPEIPPRVEYELTPLGRSLEQPIRFARRLGRAEHAADHPRPQRVRPPSRLIVQPKRAPRAKTNRAPVSPGATGRT